MRVVLGNLKLPKDRPEKYLPEWGRPPMRMPSVEAAFQVWCVVVASDSVNGANRHANMHWCLYLPMQWTPVSCMEAGISFAGIYANICKWGYSAAVMRLCWKLHYPGKGSIGV